MLKSKNKPRESIFLKFHVFLIVRTKRCICIYAAYRLWSIGCSSGCATICMAYDRDTASSSSIRPSTMRSATCSPATSSRSWCVRR